MACVLPLDTVSDTTRAERVHCARCYNRENMLQNFNIAGWQPVFAQETSAVARLALSRTARSKVTSTLVYVKSRTYFGQLPTGKADRAPCMGPNQSCCVCLKRFRAPFMANAPHGALQCRPRQYRRATRNSTQQHTAALGTIADI